MAWGAVAADITPVDLHPSSDLADAADITLVDPHPSSDLADADGVQPVTRQQLPQPGQPPQPGQAFCFLPLPARTGLPVQINGFFELSSNRR